MARLLFTDAKVFDGTGTATVPAEVLVEGNRIAQVAPAPGRIAREGATLVDAAGATLMPGMVEAHAHLSWPSSVGRVINAMMLPPEEHLLITAHNAKVTLESGFTSAYSAGSLGARFEIALRDEIEAGYLPGPRLIASSIERAPGNVMGVPKSHEKDHGRGPEALRDYVAARARDGVDSIKFLLSGDDGFSPGGGRTITYTEEEARAIGETARVHDVWLSCHAQAAESVKMAVRHGWRILYHCSYADEEALDMIEARKDSLFVAPAVGLLWSRMHEAEEFGIDRKKAEEMGAVGGVERMQRLYPEMKKRGIRVLPGGDYGFPYNPIGRNARDLELFVTLFGYSPREALHAATGLGGELMGMGGELGVVKPGALADLLLVDGDPTADVTILQDRERLLAIMKDGAFHKAPAALATAPSRIAAE
jgi:imidazolonepropionase-like amidohydrolase